MTKPRVIVVDDEEWMLEVCADTLAAIEDVVVCTIQNSRKAAARLSHEHFDLLVADIRMPHLSGVELLRIARQHDPLLQAVMLTAHPTVETAVESMKLGAVDYLTKPFKPDDLLALVRRLLEHKRLRDENRLLLRQVERSYSFDEIIGKSEAMLRVFELIERIAETDTDVLILGETGTGKELVVRSLHRRSKRAGGRFVPIDCGAIPEQLIESELFGHERGSFTGADARSLGLFELAHQGTLFLDEIGELPPRLQSKLLRVLQERTVRRVGGTEETAIDVRVLSGTSRELEVEVAAGRFRRDLFYRVNVARIELPPLRERSEDIPLLVAHFVRRHASQLGRPPPQIDAEALEILCALPWPGNVRELQNAIKRLLATCPGGHITADDLPDDLVMRAGERSASREGPFFEQRERHQAAFEIEFFTDLLRRHGGDVVCVAEEAQLPRGTVYRLLKKHAISPAEFRS